MWAATFTSLYSGQWLCTMTSCFNLLNGLNYEVFMFRPVHKTCPAPKMFKKRHHLPHTYLPKTTACHFNILKVWIILWRVIGNYWGVDLYLMLIWLVERDHGYPIITKVNHLLKFSLNILYPIITKVNRLLKFSLNIRYPIITKCQQTFKV